MSQSAQDLTYSVLLADDHSIVRHAIKTILETDPRFSVVAESDNFSSTLSLLKELKPDLMLLDIALPDHSGLELLHRMRELELPTRTVMLTMFEDEGKVKSALAAGATGYLLKDCAPAEILSSLEKATAGGIVLPERFKHIADDIEAQGEAAISGSFDPLGKLSRREREVFFLLVEGQPNRAIAKKLFVSPRTVETHRARLIKKLSLSNTADLIRFAIKHELIKV